MNSKAMERIVDDLSGALDALRFGPPVDYVYNPLVYARQPFMRYYRRFGQGRKEVVLLGMNPGPWGMAQTGVPFGDVDMVKGWLGIEGLIGTPDRQHPKRPVLGFECRRGEVSGQRLWGWARDRFVVPQRFFAQFWVANYCPLIFMEAGGRNRTPDKLKKDEKRVLFDACDIALRRMIELTQPRYVIGVGNFAYQRAAAALPDTKVRVGRITHPSPANPKANSGWSDLIEGELRALGLSF